MFYFGNFLFFFASSLAVELTSYGSYDPYTLTFPLILCLIVACIGIEIACLNYRKLHPRTPLGRSLGIAMIATAIVSTFSEECAANSTPSLILFLGYLVPGLFIYLYNMGAKGRMSLAKIKNRTVKFLKERLEYNRQLYEEMYAQKYHYRAPVKETVSVDEVILHLNLAYRIYTGEEGSKFKESLKKCQLYLLEMKKFGSETLGSHSYLIEEIDKFALLYIELMAQYVKADESEELYEKLEKAFEMINTALGNIYSEYLRKKIFDAEVSIKTLELQLGEKGLLQPKFKNIE